MEQPLVVVLMGSTSDEEIMAKATSTLADFNIEYEKKIISAHRNPKKLNAYVSDAKERGVKVFIAGAGKAAHLGGAIAALTTLPVIAVPIAGSDLGGLDALLSMVQMPSGVPVATVAINGSKNAAILAVQMLALGDTRIDDRLKRFKADLEG